MSVDENKALVRTFVEEVYNQGKLDAIAGFCVPGSFLAGGLGNQVMAMRSAFPDVRLTVDDLIAEGDKVVARATQHGTNSGPLVGLPAFGRLEQPVPPTGKFVTSEMTIIFTLRDGRVLSLATHTDQIGLLQQLGWTFTPPAAQVSDR
jgi:predicted ester cyclase